MVKRSKLVSEISIRYLLGVQWAEELNTYDIFYALCRVFGAF